MPYLPPFSDPDLKSLIFNCCLDNSDEAFARFQQAWDPFLEAALARFIQDWGLAKPVSNAAYNDYRNTFKKPFNSQFDYPTYFVAIAYAHLLRVSQSAGLRLLLQRIGIFPKETGTYVLVFCAIFQLPHECRFSLLSQCFHPVVLGLDNAALACVSQLARILLPALR